ncbi:MAG TPA: anthranilate synthase component I family protein [Deltaproteobacteria bacterium]|nr:anthranilate synthase component I family protein [Deltaproteobacteria bacterium]HPR53767.1 anthranilate synthase component I family protein [Deltaproteobacteria bacterium]HXK46784.1 anthranilate synthase component I family protein [Deltaproteobacteria bacterium]
MKIFRDVNDQGVLVMQSLACDTVTPVGAYMALVGESQGFLLESVPVAYSFVGRFDADGILSVDEGAVDPWSFIPAIPQPLHFNGAGLPPFIGGYVGYIGYDMVRGVETLPRPPIASGFPDALLGRVSTLLVFDHLKQDLKLLRAIHGPGIQERDAASIAGRDFREIEDRLFSGRIDARAQMPRIKGIQEVSLSDGEFTDAVLRAKEYLHRGDIMQVVLSRRVKIDLEGEPFDAYRRLRLINPSPYLFFIRIGEVTLIGSSPEEMVRLQGDTITTVPIAGTRPRGRSDTEDDELAADLLGDEKERAEHLMLLDLARNDLGRVCRPGSVRVAAREKVRLYSHVMHIVSCVEGDRLSGVTAADVLKACFPAGTVSGAPKVRAMEIIDELEGRCRGPYAGAVGYLSFNGNMDTGIMIRTIFSRAGETYLQAGAGIVWDSTPEREMQEIDNKLKALQAALGGI